MTYQIFLISPGGLEEERACLREVVHEYNLHELADREISFEIVGWEDVAAGSGRPQDLINPLLESAHLCCMLLHDRWGSPPQVGDGYSSGSEEEFELARRLLAEEGTPMRQAAILFKHVDPNRLGAPDDQLERVLQFRTRLEREKEFLYSEFRDLRHLERLFRRCLAQWSRDESASLPLPVSGIGRDGTTSSSVLSHLRAAQALLAEGRVLEAERGLASASAAGDLAATIAYGGYLRARGYHDLSMRVLRAASDKVNDSTFGVDVYRFLALAEASLGNMDEAQAAIAEALSAAEATGHPVAVARVQEAAAVIAGTRGLWDEAQAAIRAAEEALATAAADGKAAARWSFYQAAGRIAEQFGQFEEALRLFQAALEDASACNEMRGIASSQLGVANQLFKLGRLSPSSDSAASALEMYRAQGSTVGQAMVLLLQGHLAKAAADTAQAEALYSEALRLNEELGRSVGTAHCLGALGLLHQANGEFERAEAEFRRQLELLRTLGSPLKEADALLNLGCSKAAVDHSKPPGEFDEAEAIYARLRYARGLGDVARNRAAVDGNAGRLEAAMTQTTKALKKYAESGHLAGRMETLLNLGSIHRKAGREVEAQRVWLDLEGEARRAGFQAIAESARQRRIGEPTDPSA